MTELEQIARFGDTIPCADGTSVANDAWTNTIWLIRWAPNSQLVALFGGDYTWLKPDGVKKVRAPLLADRGLDRLVALPHEDAWIHDLAFDPDGMLLATACGTASGGGYWERPYEYYDCAVWLWGAEDGRLLATFEQPHRPVSGVSFDPSGRLLLAVSGEPAVRVWDVTEAELLVTLKDREEPAVLGPGDLLAVRKGHTVELRDARSGKSKRKLKVRGVKSLAISSCGGWIATGTASRTQLWRADGTLAHALESGSDKLAFSPDGHQLLARSEGGIQVWSVEEGELLFERDVPCKRAFFSGDGARVICSGHERTSERGPKPKRATALRASDGAELGEARSAWKLAPSPDGRWIIELPEEETWGEDQPLAVVRRFGDSDAAATLPRRWIGFIRFLAFSPDGRWLMASDQEGTWVWRVEDHALLEERRPFEGVGWCEGAPLGVAPKGDSSALVRLGHEDEALVSQIKNRSKRLLSADGRFLAVSADERTTLWRLSPETKKLWTLGFEHLEAFSPDGTLFVRRLYGDVPGIAIHRTSDGELQLEKRLEGDGLFLDGFAFSEDNSMLAVGYDKELFLYYKDGDLARSIRLDSRIEDLCFSSDSAWIVCGTSDSTSLYEVDTGELLTRANVDGRHVALTRDRSLIATATIHSLIYLYRPG